MRNKKTKKLQSNEISDKGMSKNGVFKKKKSSDGKQKIPRIGFLNNIGIAQKLIIAFMIISIVPLSTIAGFSYLNAEKTIKDKVGLYSKQMVEQAAININSKIEQLENISMMIISNDEFISILQQEEYENIVDKMRDNEKLRDTLFSISVSNNDISGVYIYKNNGEVYGTGRDITSLSGNNSDTEASRQFLADIATKHEGKNVWVTGLNNSYEFVTLTRQLRNLKTLSHIGTLAIYVDYKKFNSIIDQSDSDSSEIMLLDENRNIIVHRDPNLLGSPFTAQYTDNIYGDAKSDNFTDADEVISYATAKNGWKVVTKAPVSALMQEMEVVKSGIIGVSILCIIISALVGLFMAFSISKPLKFIMNLMGRIEQGDLTVSSPFKGKNEIGRLSGSFNKMIENIRNLIMQTQNVADQVENDTIVIKNSSELSAAAAAQVSTAISELATGSTEQAKQAENGNALMENLAQNINHVIKRIDDIMDSVRQTESSRDYAVNTIDKLNEKNKNAVESSNIIYEEIKQLSEGAKEIIQVVNVITGISEQTNLLSLNAAIEAARAGDAGRGFAVVAEEIRKLAMGTKEATGLIEQIVSKIQAQTEKAVNVVQESGNIFEEQNKIVIETNSAFNDMAQCIQKIIQQIEDVNIRMQDIENQKEESVKAIAQIAAIVEQNASTIEEVTATSEEQASSSEQLAQLAGNLAVAITTLKDSLSKFRIQ